MDGRPVGQRAESTRSDWTEQDLLTRDEALPRLEQAIAEVEAERESTVDAASRDALSERLAAMNTVRDGLLVPGPERWTSTTPSD